MQTINVTTGAHPTQLIAAGDGPTLLFNNDETNKLVLCNDIGLNILNQDGNTILEPLGSVVVMGKLDVYAAPVTPGITVEVFLIPDAIYFSPSPAQIAAQINTLGLATLNEQINQNTTIPGNIAVTGTPLLHGYNQIQFQSVLTIPAGNTGFSGGNFVKPGYFISLIATISNPLATFPIAQVEMLWQDPTSAVIMGQENWYMFAGNGSNSSVYGKGVTKGPHLAFSVKNLDPTYTMTVTFTIYESTHHITRDDWRGGPITTFPFTLPGLGNPILPFNDPFSLNLANCTGAPAANATENFILPMYAGQVDLNFLSTVSQAYTIGVFSLQATSYPQIFGQTFTAKFAGPYTIILPRAPCILQITNGAAPSNVIASLTAIEYAS